VDNFISGAPNRAKYRGEVLVEANIGSADSRMAGDRAQFALPGPIRRELVQQIVDRGHLLL
jgi:hypothetical protein